MKADQKVDGYQQIGKIAGILALTRARLYKKVIKVNYG
jgi:hypothetical protein